MVKEVLAVKYQTGEAYEVSFSPVHKCPICHTSFNGETDSATLFPHVPDIYGLHAVLLVVHYCAACENPFVSSYFSIDCHDFEYTDSWPTSPEPQSHDSAVEKLSPNYIKIYAQACQAERNSLTEICGMGYRKALEFLVKDYAIYRVPSDEKTIKALPLAKCIDKYIDSTRIKSLAQRSSWLGNDETHYVRAHQNRSYLDIKKFLYAIETFVSADLAVDDAESIPHK